MDHWRHRLERHLTQAWLQRGPTAWLLLPIALLYSAIDHLRRLAYRCGLKRSQRVGARVVVVGNVIAGGAGKTPTVIALARDLQRLGHQVGIVSRGYGSTHAQVQEVRPDSSASSVGDEPLLMRRALNLPVFVGRDRVAAAKSLLAHYPATSVVLCDDGLQHLRLYRDVEVYVFDNRGVGNAWPLPAGPLRSPWPPRWVQPAGQDSSRALVLHTGNRPAFAGFCAERTLQSYGVDSTGTRFALSELGRGAQPCVALAGIAQPQAFFDLLTQQGVRVQQCIALPDHYDFQDWQIPAIAGCAVLCTEKDAVKLWPLMPQAIAIPLEQTIEAGFYDALHAKLASSQGS
ncbi:tetraacyldisaccharide 4'-kinase [Curvibacter sp. APW13]|uniref:tetraacyldisaccharide 4'-kinase n=1 Tax=Curvibacter sp. APW13 TaxID=3077236 RepID=UPI0028DED107|nr:tetraacyldisaccharide 4'-kinase [Curvibacter sp. APW13]MDT8992094.1 tetraacyldisaccharide 4'-kinase [Curvibacter sp. APW13]